MCNIKFIPYPKIVEVDNLDQAYKDGWFSSSKSHRELYEIIVKKNPHLKFLYGEYGCGIYDTSKSEQEYIYPLGKLNPVPKFTLQDRKTKKILCRGWPKILEALRRKGYEINY